MTGSGAVPTAAPEPVAHQELRTEVRLRMKGRPAARGLDGAWWPRSLDPEAEFPGLVLVISSWVGPVCRVVYRVEEWDAAGVAATSDGWPFELEVSDALQPNIVVVPPGVPGRVARAVLSSAAGPGAVESAAQALAGHGIRSEPHRVVDRPSEVS
jgi:hypothetical protein